MSHHYQFNYSFTGKKSNPIILFLHGFMGDGSEFNKSISYLTNKFCCLTIDLPGHGKTKVLGTDKYYNMNNTAQALYHLLKQLKINQCFLVGYSMGGRLALYMALHFPQFFPKVVLESASPGLKTESARQKRVQKDEQLAQKLETTNFTLFLSQWYNQPLFNSLRNHPQFTHICQRRLQNNPFELAKSLRIMGTGQQPNLWHMLREYDLPLLLLVGELDRKFKAINTQITKLCSQAQLEVIPNCGHNIHEENVDAFVERIVLFLQ